VRSAFARWVANPEPRDPRSVEDFCKRFKTTYLDLARYMTDPRFWDVAMGTLTPWRMKLSRVRLGIYNNSIDHTRADQWEWIQRYYQLCRVRGFEKMEGGAETQVADGTITLMRPAKK
jgi:hypothetical protein